MKIQYSFFEDDLVEFQRFHCAKSPYVRKQRLLIMAIFTAAILLFAIILKSDKPDALTIVPRLIIGCFVSAAFCIYLQFAWRRSVGRQIRHLIREGSTDGLFGSYELEVDNKGITRRNATRTSFAAWSVVRRTEDTPGHVIIYISSIEAFVVPRKRVLDGDLDQLLDVVRGNVQSAGNNAPMTESRSL